RKDEGARERPVRELVGVVPVAFAPVFFLTPAADRQAIARDRHVHLALLHSGQVDPDHEGVVRLLHVDVRHEHRSCSSARWLDVSEGIPLRHIATKGFPPQKIANRAEWIEALSDARFSLTPAN